MTASVESTGVLERRLEVSVPASEVEQAYAARLKTFSRTARLKGFRPGKAPLAVIARQFGSQIREEVVSELVRSSLGSALNEHRLAPVGGPRIEPLSTASGQDLKYAAVFEVYPTIELKGSIRSGGRAAERRGRRRRRRRDDREPAPPAPELPGHHAPGDRRRSRHPVDFEGAPRRRAVRRRQGRGRAGRHRRGPDAQGLRGGPLRHAGWRDQAPAGHVSRRLRQGRARRQDGGVHDHDQAGRGKPTARDRRRCSASPSASAKAASSNCAAKSKTTCAASSATRSARA